MNGGQTASDQLGEMITKYIDAGPHQPALIKASCTARPDHKR